MPIPIEQEPTDPFAALRWANLLDDVSDAHNKMDAHLEQSDERRHEFEARMLTNAKMATIMYHTLNELKELTVIQQARIGELEASVDAQQEQIEGLQHYKQMPVISSDTAPTLPAKT